MHIRLFSAGVVRRSGRRLRRRPTPLASERLECRTLLAYTIQLTDNTQLADHTLYAIGYTTSDTPTYLVNAGSNVGSFTQYGSSAPASGKIEGVKINRPANGTIPAVTGGISQITLVSGDDLNGGGIFVVAVPDSWTTAPYVTYTGTGSAVTPPGIPADNWPGTQPSFVFTELEFTKLQASTLTIDATQVNFWSMPVTGSSGSLSLGQPPTLERDNILAAYRPFIEAEKNLQSNPTMKAAYRNLLNPSLGWILSPISFGQNSMPSEFQTAWDADLRQLFGGPSQPGMQNIRTYFPGELDYWTGNAQATPDGRGGFNYSLRFTKDGTNGRAPSEWFEIDSPLNATAESLYGPAGFQVYGCTGTFLNPRGYAGAGKPIGTQIVTALNRGVALFPADGTSGSNSQLWSTQTNWYPADQNYNNYARFMHVAKTADGTQISEYTGRTPTKDAQGGVMGPAYGFPQDENDQNFVPGKLQVGTYPVPFEFGSLADPATVTFSFGPWGSVTPAGPIVAGTSFTVPENAPATPLVWDAPLAGFTASPITVTLALTGGSAAGALTATEQTVTGGTITPTGSPAAGWSIEGTQSQLNEYFAKSGAVTFQPLTNSTATQQLTMSAAAGSQQAAATSVITIVPVNAGPVVTLVPASFTTNKGTQVTLAYTAAPFSDSDPTMTAATTFRVTVTAPAGTLAATSTTSVTVGGTASALTFTPVGQGGADALTALNQYFVGGNVKYTPPAGSTATQSLTTVLKDTTDNKVSNSAITQVFIGQAGTPIVQAPIAFWVPVDQRRNLVWPRGLAPFADSDSRTLTVTLAVGGGAGTLTAASGGGVTRNADGSLTGTVRALNAYFQTVGRITYVSSGSSLLPRTLSVFVTDGTRSGTATSAILVRSRGPLGVPAINRSAALGSTPAGTPLVITYAQFVAATGATTANSRSVEFLLGGVSSGRLELWDGAKWIRVPAPLPKFKEPILAPGGQIRWTPPARVTGPRAAFRAIAWDGWKMSAIQSQVSVDVT